MFQGFGDLGFLIGFRAEGLGGTSKRKQEHKQATVCQVCLR